MEKRIAPTVSDPTMQRVITDLYDIINSIIDMVDNKELSKANQSEPGKINVVKSGSEYTLEVKAKDGWYQLSSNLVRKTGKKEN
tara:strand:- start:2753 stop:3004 length:252 start_codon:yes stop_codon:yes gene_type:complete